jgi:hypothetical protein
MGHWALGIGHWLLVIGYWLLVIGYWLLVIGYWLLVRTIYVASKKYVSRGLTVLKITKDFQKECGPRTEE